VFKVLSVPCALEVSFLRLQFQKKTLHKAKFHLIGERAERFLVPTVFYAVSDNFDVISSVFQPSRPIRTYASREISARERLTLTTCLALIEI